MPKYNTEQATELVIQVGAQAAGVEDIETLGENPMNVIGKTLKQISPSGWQSTILAGLVDKIYKTEYESKIFENSQDLGITMEVAEYGIVKEITRFKQPEFVADQSYMLVDGRSYDPHVFRANESETKYFEGGSPYMMQVSIPGSQINDVFFNGGDVAKFINGIWAQVTNRVTRNKRDNELNAVTVHIAMVYDHREDFADSHVVNDLRLGYNAYSGKTIKTREEFMRDPDALRYALKEFMKTKDLMNDMTVLMNPEGNMEFTNSEDLNFVALSDFYRAIEMNVYNAPNQFKTDKLEIQTPKLVTRWQGYTSTQDDELTTFSTIDVTTPENKVVTLKGVVATMFDKRALFGTMKPEESESTPTAGARFTNYFRHFFYRYNSNLSYNSVVFVVSDEND